MTTLSDALQGALADSLKSVSKDWTELKRHADREQRVSERRLREFRVKRHEVSIKEAAYQIMEQAYFKASANGSLPANARQIMYAARPMVMALTGGKCWRNSSTFTQVLLIDYMKAHDVNWNVVFDARGHLSEPHTEKGIGLGTLEVRSYLQGWRKAADTSLPVVADLLRGFERLVTRGPHQRYGAVLYVEKEGFNPLLEAARIAERFDVAIASNKGMSVTAMRDLVTALSIADVPTFVLHDFDKSGLSILHTLRTSTRRYEFHARPLVFDLGLRLDDILALDLESESVEYPSGKDPRINLRESGATQAECDFLVRRGGRLGWDGERVEINAMASDQFVEWLEDKLQEAGVKKVVPDQETLAAAYQRARRIAAMTEQLRQLELSSSQDDDVVPDNLVQLVADRLMDSDDAWDHAVWQLATEPAENKP